MRLGFIALLLIALTGCSFLSSPGGKVYVPPRDMETPPHAPKEPDKNLDVTDGFDFPVGDRDGRGWGVTGYAFLDWSTSSNSLHPGEDWNIPGAGNGDYGQPIYSIANGRVRHSLWNSALGHVVVIEHQLPDGTKVWSQYAHLAERWVVPGEKVARRQQIGTVGRGPNNRFTAHLHFEIRRYDLAANAWPRTNGVAWPAEKVQQYWLHPSAFIARNRPSH